MGLNSFSQKDVSLARVFLEDELGDWDEGESPELRKSIVNLYNYLGSVELTEETCGAFSDNETKRKEEK